MVVSDKTETAVFVAFDSTMITNKCLCCRADTKKMVGCTKLMSLYKNATYTLHTILRHVFHLLCRDKVDEGGAMSQTPYGRH